MTANEDLLFVELALKKELVTQEQVDEILALQRKLEGMGLTEAVAELMLKKGMLSEEDAGALRTKVSPKGGRQQIEGYRLIERLGRGGMGSVYKAIQLSMGRPVAVKVLKPSLTTDDQRVERLRREAQLVGKLQHPNIVQGLDHGVSSGFHYFVMEYVDGASVKEIIDEQGLFREKEALRIVREVAEALKHAHGEGVVHRDVKPGNILLAQDGKVKLADYGLAKGPLEDVELTQSGVTVGTPQYISPEQARGPSEVDVRTDIYSLGATLYHMVTGRPPYEGETLAHLIQQVLYEPYAPPQTLRRNLSPSVAFLIEKMMARRPRFRYQSPDDLLADLDRIDAGKSIVPAGWEGDLETFYLRRRLKRWVTVAVVVVLLGAAGTVYGIWRNREAERRKMEANALRAYEVLAAEEITPRNLMSAISRLESVTEEYPGTEAAGAAEADLARLRPEVSPLQSALATREVALEKSARGEFRAALLACGEQAGALPHEATALARQVLMDCVGRIKRLRDEEFERSVDELVRSVLDKKPEEARDRLEGWLVEKRGKAFLEDEPKTALAETVELARRLGRAIELTDEFLSGPAEKLRAGGTKRDYREIERQRTEAREAYGADPGVRGLLGELPGKWPEMLTQRFEDLEGEILRENEEEAGSVSKNASQLALEGRFEPALKALSEALERSLDPAGDTLYGHRETLEKDWEERKQTTWNAWLEFFPLFLDDLAHRRWPAARVRIDSLRTATAIIEPHPRELELRGAEQLYEDMKAYEARFLEKIDGRRLLPNGLKFRTITEPEMHDIRIEGRKIFFRRKPGGKEEQDYAENVALDDIRREAGDPEGDGRALILAILELGEILGKAPQKRLLDLPLIKGEVLELARHSAYAILVPLVDQVLNREIEAAGKEIQQLELAARGKWDVGNQEMARAHWRQAYEAFNQLLTDTRYKYTDFVKQREQEIKDLRAEAERRRSSGKLAEPLRARVAHLGGSPVGTGGDTLVAISWDLDRPEELDRFEYSKGRIGIVEEEGLFVGPPAPGRPVDEVRTVVDHHLRFHPPVNQPGDRLDRHPLRLDSPLMYQRGMSIEFRARWERPLALLVSLCGTNLLVLSDTKRQENGRGVHIWQGSDLSRPDLIAPEFLRASYLGRNPEALKGEAAERRYFRFEADHWYRVKFTKGDKFARLWVGGWLVFEQKIHQYGGWNTGEILILTYSPMRLDDLRIQGTVDKDWLSREGKRRGGGR